MSQTVADIVVFMVRGAIDVLISGLTQRQIQIIHFAITAMEQVHKKKPNFLTRKGITQTEIEELKAILEDFGKEDDSVLPVPPNAYIV
jgi:hypothetical protein